MLSKVRTRPSLKRSFLKRFFWGMLFGWIVIGSAIYFITGDELDELYDGEMAQIAHVLLAIYADQDFPTNSAPQTTSSPFEGDDNYERKLAFQIWGPNGKLQMRSENAPLEVMTRQIGELQTTQIYDSQVRVLAIASPDGNLVVQVGQNLDIRRENASEILRLLAYVLVLSFPVLLWLISRGLNQGTASLNALSDKIAHRTEHDLSPIRDDTIPAEIAGIVNALNALMSRVQSALGRERQFISDAAHELRTPLAGIKSHAQLALKIPDQQQNSLTRIVEGVDRTTRLANQLLTLSGIDSMERLETTGPVDVTVLIHTQVEDLDHTISEKHIRISREIETPDLLHGNKDLLYILLRNLIDNAIRYAPEHSEVTLIYSRQEDTLRFTVIDQGPGIDPSQRERVFDRFYRDIENDVQGSGLGLAIAANIAALHQAKIQLEPAPGASGLAASVIFNRMPGI